MIEPETPTPEPVPSTPEPLPDKWCPARMADFLRTLASTHSVATAARSVGMSRQSAYRLRARLKGEPFDIAWEAAFQHSYDALAQAALERALHGVEMPVYRGGELVGSYRKYDERLTCFLLARRNLHGAQQLGRYTAAADFWSERWDRMLDLVEHGPGYWTQENGDPHDEKSRLADDDRDVRLAVIRHGVDDPSIPPAPV